MKVRLIICNVLVLDVCFIIYYLLKLLRLSICDCKTGICLFDLIWNENYVVIPSSLGSLISSFYQISREFGDTGGMWRESEKFIR
jgi:hypothetical protein